MTLKSYKSNPNLRSQHPGNARTWLQDRLRPQKKLYRVNGYANSAFSCIFTFIVKLRKAEPSRYEKTINKTRQDKRVKKRVVQKPQRNLQMRLDLLLKSRSVQLSDERLK